MVSEVVNAAIRSSEKKITANTDPAYICENTIGKLWNTKVGPESGGNAEAEERRENHKARKYGDDGIGNCRDNCRLNQIFVFIQIAGQGNHHAET